MRKMKMMMKMKGQTNERRFRVPYQEVFCKLVQMCLEKSLFRRRMRCANAFVSVNMQPKLSYVRNLYSCSFIVFLCKYINT